ncbi:MAG TPA: tRNA (adenosine(37)-N6)-threonylcarbamoyltransferase complex transferase subunit TsaD [Bacillota bacterium]|nr:tRNA (adenosine(37)-N6)-threonylcarbamoyltransferase complex transferase subunit TsaD [Bacillota bacterium]
MNILAIESSCDETSAAVVCDGRALLSCKVASQIEIHARYGGVVPEIASRAHTEALIPCVRQALDDANIAMDAIDAVAVTACPGLIGALLTGVSFAKGLAYSFGKPLIPVHHIRGHVAAAYLTNQDLKPPFTALVVSGGHTSLLQVDDYSSYRTVGRTRDDAAGEALDKAARVLGLPYPGGAKMDAMALLGDPESIKFSVSHVDGAPYDFSFSGLKTSVVNHMHTLEMKGIVLTEQEKNDIAASFMATLVKTLTSRLSALMDTQSRPIVLAGGVAASKNVRNEISSLCEKRKVKLYMPEMKLCGDNAAMIGAQGYYEYISGNIADLSLNARASCDV